MKKQILMAAATLTILTAVGTTVSAEEITIKSGDTLSALAKEHNVTVDFLSRLNDITNPDLIYAGEKLFTEQADRPDKDLSLPVVVETAPVQEHAYTPEVSATPTTPSAPAEAPTVSVTGSEAVAKEEIARRESGGSYDARNGRYIGRYQLTDSYLGGDYSPANQERVAEEYVRNRYGSWTAALEFWNANGWY